MSEVNLRHLIAAGELALCARCRRACFSWTTPSMFDDFGVDKGWSHVKLTEEDHFAVPMSSIRERTLMCSSCRQPQQFGPVGWYCGNNHCPTKVDND